MEPVQFRPGEATITGTAGPGATELQRQALTQRVEQILGRNSSAAADPYCAFVIDPALRLNSINKSEGLTRNVTLASGELVLNARNAYDGTLYYSLTQPLEVAVTGGEEKAVDALINGIKVRDAAYTRFLRTVRGKVAEYYQANCDRIIVRATHLHNQGDSEGALAYLAAVPDTSPCYDEAATLSTRIVRKDWDTPPQSVPEETVASEPQATPAPAPTPEPTTPPVPEPVAEPTSSAPAPAPEPTPAPVPHPAPVQSAPQPKLYLSTDDFDVKILSAVADPLHRSIAVTVSIEARTAFRTRQLIKVENAVSADGLTLQAKNGGTFVEFPMGVKVRQQLDLDAGSTDIKELAFFKFVIGPTTVEVRDLTLTTR